MSLRMTSGKFTFPILPVLFCLLYEVPGLSLSSLTCICMRFSDGKLVLILLLSCGIEKNHTTLVHAGFLILYNTVRAVVVHVMRQTVLL